MPTDPDQHSSIFQSIPKFILLNAGIASVIALLSCLNYGWNMHALYQFGRIFVISFFMSSALSMGGYKVDTFFEEKISWLEFPLRRLMLTFSLYMLYAFTASVVILSAYFAIFVSSSIAEFEWQQIFPDVHYTVGISIAIISIFIARSWLLAWKKSAVEAELLKRELIENKYQALVQQLNPHFLFNSLNALSNLVYEDADKSADFIRKLSQIYRYLLEVQHEELIELERELTFAKDYLDLQQIRFEDSLHYEMEVQEPHRLFLPPLSIQLLLENAIKHNVFNNENPLTITIRQGEKTLTIANNYRPKEKSKSTGIGLKNVKKRFERFSTQKPVVKQTESEFSVELPLLKAAE